MSKTALARSPRQALRRQNLLALGASAQPLGERTDGRVLAGAIVIHRQEVRPFTDKQIALLQNFANIAIENTLAAVMPRKICRRCRGDAVDVGASMRPRR